jgi:peptidoglycan hydrolase FlgJ
MSLPWGTVGWSLFNQGWFKSRAVSSRKQEQRVSTLGLATTLGFICKSTGCAQTLRSTYPFFSSSIALAESRSASLVVSSDRATYLRYASSPPRSRLAPHRFCCSPGSVVVRLFCTVGVLLSGIVLAGSFAQAEAQLQMMKAQLQMVEKPVEQNTLGTISKTPPVVRDQRVLNAAKMYGKYFLGQMMKAMRSTVHKSDLEKQSMGEGIYRDQLDDQYVDTWGERGGIGLADMIHDELIGKAEMMKMRRTAMKAAKGKVRTPMALTDRDVMKVRKLPGLKTDSASSGTVETVLVSLGKTTARPEDGPESVRSPWSGRITKLESNDGKVVIGIETEVKQEADLNEAGTVSTAERTEPARKVELAFDGVTFQVRVGDVVRAGQTLGHLGKGARGILLRQTLVQGANKLGDGTAAGAGM